MHAEHHGRSQLSPDCARPVVDGDRAVATLVRSLAFGAQRHQSVVARDGPTPLQRARLQDAAPTLRLLLRLFALADRLAQLDDPAC